MEPQKTIGYIIFKQTKGAIEYLLLHHEGEYWNFPKGRQEAGETELQTANRELKEETGITDVQLLDDFRGEYIYDFDSIIENGVRETIHKHAIFFLGRVDEGTTIAVSDEHIDYGWFDFEQAVKRLYFQNGQDLLRKAHQFLLKQQDIVL